MKREILISRLQKVGGGLIFSLAGVFDEKWHCPVTGKNTCPCRLNNSVELYGNTSPWPLFTDDMFETFFRFLTGKSTVSKKAYQELVSMAQKKAAQYHEIHD